MGLVGSRRPFPILDTSRRRGALPLAPGNQNAAGPRAGDGQGQRAGAVFFRIPSIDVQGPARPGPTWHGSMRHGPMGLRPARHVVSLRATGLTFGPGTDQAGLARPVGVWRCQDGKVVREEWGYDWEWIV